MKLSVIISCYAAEQLIRECLYALVRQTYESIEIIVIDANSPDKTRDIIKNEFPSVILIEKDRIGVGEALNIGINHSTGDIIVIDFNTDEVADVKWAEYLVNSHLKWGKDHIISPARLSSKGLVEAYGMIFKSSGTINHIGGKRKYNPNRKSEICDATGINTFRRELIDKIGLVDEKFIFYGADVDFSLRARLIGYTIRTEPKAFTIHQRSASKSLDYRKFYKHMNYGIIRQTLIHGTLKINLFIYGNYMLFFPIFTFIKGLKNLIFRNSKYQNQFEEVVGRINGVRLFLSNFAKDIKIRKKYTKRLIS